MFWTEYGHGSNVPKVGRAYLDGSGNVTIADTDYKWPNALAIYENQLFVADGKYRRVDVMGLDGKFDYSSYCLIFGQTIAKKL